MRKNLKKSVLTWHEKISDNLLYKFLQFLQLVYEFVFFKDLRAKAMVKPGLAHEHSYEFTLIQRKIRVWFRAWFRVWFGKKPESDSESESKSESENFRAKCDMNRSWISTELFLKNFLIQYWIALKVSYGRT